MARKLKPIEVGQRFGRLKFIKDLNTIRISKTQTIRIALFSCDCGNKKELAVHNVLHGKTKSCGCLVKTHNGLTTTTQRKLKIEPKIKEGFFDYDAYVKSDFILQS